jgi:maltose/maltodextrin transport system permease protein
MPLPPGLKRFLGPTLLGLTLLASLYVITLVYATGETLLAGTLLVITALALWIYTSAKLYAYRYLFPGIAAALIFVVFPMVYTLGIGFTNYSSKNLLEFKRATQYLLEESYRADGVAYHFTLHPEGGAYRIRLEDADAGKVFETTAFTIAYVRTHPALKAEALPEGAPEPPEPVAFKELIDLQKDLKPLAVTLPDGSVQRMTGLREFAPSRPQYTRNADGSLTNNESGVVIRPNFKTGYYETPEGEAVKPGFHVGVGFDNFKHILTDSSLREPFGRVFLWTVIFSVLTVVFATSLGLLLAVLLSWDALRFRSVYRLLLFLPYAVPGFISILVFKGLFNNNTGEINLILNGLFGVKPTWFSDPFLAKSMLLIVNTWLGFPYMMVVCMGLIKAIPQDLYEASAVAGAGPITNFFRITWPLIRRPLTPLLISSFAYNFNNFVLISLLTGGRPDFLDTSVPAGTTDILVSYTYRMAFQDSGQQFGLAAAISTLIFFMVAGISLVQIRATRIAEDDKR